jgi:hypothetical protein
VYARQATGPDHQGQSPAWSMPGLATPSVAGAVKQWAEQQYQKPNDEENEVEIRHVIGKARRVEIVLSKGNHGHYVIDKDVWKKWEPKTQNILILSLVREEYCE